MKKTDKRFYIGVIIIILIVIIAFVIDKKSTKNEPILESTQDISNGSVEKNANITKILQDMEERERMEYYVGMFVDYVESGKYEVAYNLLYEDFKNNYFPTIEDFKNYMPTLFSEMSNIEYENIERSGDLYVLWINITDAVNGKVGDKKQINVVIKENDYNDFVLSFSVI